MIDSCGLHIGCFLTCTSGVNTLSVDLLATVSGTHEIEYHFLDRVIRFEIEATIGLPFEIPTTYFNESGDARIKIVLPDGSYYTHMAGTSVYDTFYLTVRQSTDTNFVPAVIPPVVDGVAIPVNYSETEQIWPYEKYFGLTVYWRTFVFGAGDGTTPVDLPGFLQNSVSTIVKQSHLIYKTSASSASKVSTANLLATGLTSTPYTIVTIGISSHITVWYTKP